MTKKVTFSVLLTEEERQGLGKLAKFERRRDGDALRLALYEALVRRQILSEEASVQAAVTSRRSGE